MYDFTRRIEVKCKKQSNCIAHCSLYFVPSKLSNAIHFFLQIMIRILQSLLYCQVCFWAIQAAPSLSKMEGVIAPDESVQSLTNNMGNSLYNDIGSASPSARSHDLISQNKDGQTDLKPSEHFSVTNTITSSGPAKTFDQTSPAFNEVKPTAKGLRAKPKVGKNKKQKKDKSKNKPKKTTAVMPDNSLLGQITTTPMPGFDNSWGEGMFAITTTANSLSDLGGFTPDYTTTPDPLVPEQNNPPTPSFARKFTLYILFTIECLNSKLE